MCVDGVKFVLKIEKIFDIMCDINVDYCDGEGLGKFIESNKYYMFKCKFGIMISVSK